MSQKKIDILERALVREKMARKQAEKILESKSRDLYHTTQELKGSNKKLEHLLDEKSSELSIIVNNSSLGIVLTQFGKILKTNFSIQNLLGYSKDELLELTIKDISFEEDLSESKILLDKLDNCEIDHFTTVKRYKTKLNKIIWAKTNVNAVRDTLGNIKYQVAVIEDITRKREETLMLEVINDVAKAMVGKDNIYEIASEIAKKIATYLDTNDCVIYQVNRDKTIEQIAAFGGKLDTKKEIKNKLKLNIGEGIVGNVAKTGIAEINGDTSKNEKYFVDIETRFSEITIPIMYGSHIIGVIDAEHIEKDYFTKKHLETLIKISSLVALEVKKAVNLEKLRKAEKQNNLLLNQLENSNQELHDYAHIVSHDLKSPLRSISSLVSWLKEDYHDIIDDKGVDNFNFIQEKLEKMDQLIDGILTYSSVESKNIAVKNIDLNNVVKNVIDTVFLPKHITIKILNKLPVIRADSTRIQQLFQNLITNAINHIDKKLGKIEIGFKEHKNHFEFYISDNGEGISKEYHKKIFEIFQSVSNKNSTGIGLSIVKKIINIYQGKIWVESELNEGATFYFTLKK